MPKLELYKCLQMVLLSIDFSNHPLQMLCCVSLETWAHFSAQLLGRTKESLCIANATCFQIILFDQDYFILIEKFQLT